jgi:hypothetical protein
MGKEGDWKKHWKSFSGVCSDAGNSGASRFGENRDSSILSFHWRIIRIIEAPV